MDVSKLILFIFVGLWISYDNLSEKPYYVPTKVFSVAWIKRRKNDYIKILLYYETSMNNLFPTYTSKGIQNVISMMFTNVVMVFFLIFVCIVCNVCWIKSNKCKAINLAMCIRFRKNALKDTISNKTYSIFSEATTKTSLA